MAKLKAQPISPPGARLRVAGPIAVEFEYRRTRGTASARVELACWRDMTESKPNLGRCAGYRGCVSHAHEHSDFSRAHQSMTEPCCQELFCWWSRAALSRAAHSQQHLHSNCSAPTSRHGCC